MIQRQLKLRVTAKQEDILNNWLWHLTGVWNFAIRKIELDAKDGVYHSKFDFISLLVNHSKKLNISAESLQSMLSMAWMSWDRCFKGIAKRPRLKGMRNKLNSIPFPNPIKSPDNNKIRVPLFGLLRYHKQEIPEGTIKCGRIVRRASGWYLCLFIDAQPNKIERLKDGVVGIDPGFKTNLTLSTGEKIDRPKHLEIGALRLAQAQRGKNKKLTGRLYERIKNRRKDDSHKLSRKLCEENKTIFFSKDNIRGISKKFGKSVSEAGHYQLRQMLNYKCIASGSSYVEIDSKNSTMTCSNCQLLTGPTGWAGLSIRDWECSGCGATHDRDANAAVNTLNAGLGLSLEGCA